MTDHTQLTFLGLTKTQFMGMIVTALVILAAMLSLLVYRYTDLAEQGAQSHGALCVLKQDYAKRASDSQAFLRMSVPRREKKYGKALGRIPDSVVQQSLHGYEANLVALKSLKCE